MGCNINVPTIQVLYGLLASLAVICICVSFAYTVTIRRLPERLLGPMAFMYAVASLIFAVARVVDPIARTIGNDPLVTTAFALSSLFLFAFDHVLVVLYVDGTANSVYREAALDLENLATRLRHNYLPRSFICSVFLSTVPTLCMLASPSPIVMEALTGLQWLLYAVMGMGILSILLLFMGASLRAFDSAISAARLSPSNLSILPKLERTRGSIARTRFIVRAIMSFDLCVCLIVAPWPAAQANLSYIVPYVWNVNALAMLWFQYTYAKPHLPSLFGGAPSADSSNATPSNLTTNNNEATNDANARSFIVVGGTMSTVVEEEYCEGAPARHIVPT